MRWPQDQTARLRTSGPRIRGCYGETWIFLVRLKMLEDDLLERDTAY
jgi:hypothetical protein